MPQFKELEIPEEFRQSTWSTSKVKIQKWNLSIRNYISSECQKVKPILTGRGLQSVQASDFDWGQHQILTILKCVSEAPWQVGDIGRVNELEPALGDWLYKEIMAHNEGGLKNLKGLVESSEGEPSPQ